MTVRGSRLAVAYIWRRHLLAYRLLYPGQSISFGSSKRATLFAPAGTEWPACLPLVKAVRAGHRLRLWPGMTGEVKLAGAPSDIASLLAAPDVKRALRRARVYRDLQLRPGDSAEIVVDTAAQLRLRLAYVERPEVIPRPRLLDREPLLVRTVFWATSVTMATLAAIIFFGDRVKGTRDNAISAERYARIIAPMLEEPPPVKPTPPRTDAEAEERERKKKQERESAESRRAKNEQGKLGRADAERKDTVLPKGRQDILREKVSKTGLLAALGNVRPSGSGLGKLLTQTDSPDLEQALNGLAGAKLAVGRGSTGLGDVGTGLGGGGTSFGRIHGSGALDVGTGRGRGRRGPVLGTGREKEVSVGLETGTPDAEGGLTKEQINRVVRAHAAAIKYCYEKELQRQPNLVGRIDLFWVIRVNGAVDRVRVARSTVENREVEGCMERQVKNWQFPKSDAETIVQSYPFLFKGSS